MSKIIAVFGATGVQGGGVVAGLLKNKQFSVRAVTRNAQSEKAKALEKQGVEVVQGNLNEPATLSDVVSGCYGVFGVTNFWELFDMNKETQQGKNLVDACKNAGVKHLVFSSLEDVKGTIGKSSPHFDSKAEIEKYAFASGVPTTCVRYPGYMENFIGALSMFSKMISKTDDGTFVLGMPMEGKPLDFICAVGAGNAVLGIFDSGETYVGKTIGLTGDIRTVQEYAEILSKHLAPKKFKAGEITPEQFSKLGFPGADDLAAMFEFYQRGNPDHDLALTRKLDPTTWNFEDWVKMNKEALDASFL